MELTNRVYAWLILQVSFVLVHTKNTTTVFSLLGHSVTLYCDVDLSDPPPSWTREVRTLTLGLQVIGSNRITIFNSTAQEYNLKISNLTLLDEGIYCCDFINRARNISQNCTALEIAELKIKDSNKGILYGMAGENITISCKFTKSIGNVNLSLIHNDSVLTEDQSNDLKFTLRITKAFHWTKLVCKGHIIKLNVSTQNDVMLNISYGLSVKASALPNCLTRMSTNVVFICTYDSNSDPFSVIWIKDNIVVSHEANWTLFNASSFDTGQYRCIVNNTVGFGIGHVDISAQHTPAMPANFSVQQFQSGFRVTWTARINVEVTHRFCIKYRSGENQKWTSLEEVSTMRHRINILNLPDDTEFEVYMFALNEVGRSNYTHTVKVRTYKSNYFRPNALQFYVLSTFCVSVLFLLVTVVYGRLRKVDSDKCDKKSSEKPSRRRVRSEQSQHTRDMNYEEIMHQDESGAARFVFS